MLGAQRTRLHCQLCEHRVSRGGRRSERTEDRRRVGVNVTEQSLVILPLYSDLFVILLQMFYWSPDGATHSLHCWSVGWKDGDMEEKWHETRACTLLCCRAAAALLKARSTERFGTLLTAAGDSFFSRWCDLIIETEVPTTRFPISPGTCEKQVHVHERLYDTVPAAMWQLKTFW